MYIVFIGMKVNKDIIKKTVDSLYKEDFPGMIKDMEFVIRQSDGRRPNIDVHVLLDDKIYRSSYTKDAGGFFSIMKMEEGISSALKYLSPNSVDFFRYMDNTDDMIKWNRKFSKGETETDVRAITTRKILDTMVTPEFEDIIKGYEFNFREGDNGRPLVFIDVLVDRDKIKEVDVKRYDENVFNYVSVTSDIETAVKKSAKYGDTSYPIVGFRDI